MRLYLQRVFCVVAGMISLLTLSCATPAPERLTYNIVWPLPPEEPRVKFVGILQSNKDVEESSRLADTLFGERVELALYKPYGVTVDREDRVYVTDAGKVLVFDRKNKRLDTIGTDPGTGRLNLPIGIAVSHDGNVYVTDVKQDRVFVYDRNGKYLRALGKKDEFASPSGVAFDDARQRLYVVDSKKHNVRAFTPAGDHVLTIGQRGREPGQFNYPTNLALDDKGNIFVVDTGNFRVQVFSPEGELLRAFGKLGDRPGEFARPKGIAIDSEGHVYVADAAFDNFQIFDGEGRLLLPVGGAGLQPGEFSLPAGMFIDDEDRIYVADQLNSRVQVFQYLGEKWKARQEAQPEQGKQEGAPKPAADK